MRLLNLTIATLLLGVGFVYSDVVPVVSVKSLVDQADLIIAGKIQRVQQTGAGSIAFSGRDYERLDFQAEIRVDETIKGQPVASPFVLSYSTPSVDSVGNVARGELRADTYQVVFLKKTAQGFMFVSPYFPSLAAQPKRCDSNWQVKLGEDAYQRVLLRVLSALCTPSSHEEKNWALSILRWDEDSSVAPFLEAALNLPEVRSDDVARTSILSDLLAWNDLSALPAAEQELFDPSKHTPGYLKSNIVLAISRLDAQVSVPLLARALKLPETDARVAAARFLQYTNSQNAIDVLLTDLDDPDHEVQFAIMQSLGNLTNQHSWRPISTATDSQWFECLKYWREFEVERKSLH